MFDKELWEELSVFNQYDSKICYKFDLVLISILFTVFNLQVLVVTSVRQEILGKDYLKFN